MNETDLRKTLHDGVEEHFTLSAEQPSVKKSRSIHFNFMDDIAFGDVTLYRDVSEGKVQIGLTFVPREITDMDTDTENTAIPHTAVQSLSVDMIQHDQDKNNGVGVEPNLLLIQLRTAHQGIFGLKITSEPEGYAIATVNIRQHALFTRKLAHIEQKGWQVMTGEGDLLLTADETTHTFTILLDAAEALIQQSGLFIPESA